MKSCRAIALLTMIILAAFAAPGLSQVVDNFNRADLGTNWTADTEYRIVNNALDNTSTVTGWTYLAVYNAAVNPYEVQYTWAAGADANGINAGGFAILLDAASVSANGYLIFRRNTTLEINPIVSGNVDRTVVVDTEASTRPAPVAGSIIKVVFRTDATRAYFDYYVNGALDGTLSYLRSSRPAIPATYYAGVSLYGNMNNNIDDFTVRAQSLTVVSPNGGEIWLTNSSHAITWSSTDFTGNVAIDFSLDGGSTWSVVTASAANTGSFTWNLPASTSNSCRIRVKDAADGNPADISNANFIIEPETESITLLAPNGGENWVVNSAQEIRWQAASSIPFVRISYSSDNGFNWMDIVASEPNDGSYSWTVPAPTTNQALIRIVDSMDGLPSDESNGTFSVSSLVTLRVKDSSGQPGSTNNLVSIWIDNLTNIRGISFKLSDTPAHLTAMNVVPVGRASGFTVAKSDNGTSVTIFMVHMSGGLIPVGSGPICQVSYDVSGAATLGDFSTLDLSNVTISDALSDLVVPELRSGKFWYVKIGDLDNSSIVDVLDLNRAADIVLGKPPARTDNELLSGDTDHDGDLDLFDVLAIFELVY